MAKLNTAHVSATPSGITDYSRYGTTSRLPYQVAQSARGLYNVIGYYKWTQIAFVIDVGTLVFAAPFYQIFAGRIRM